jgi:ankyrin repeat protein
MVNRQTRSRILIFMAAKKRRRRKTIETAVGSPGDVNSPDSNGWTPLMRACSSRSMETVLAIIAGGADVNKTDDEGFGPLMCASGQGRADVIMVLLGHAAQVDAADEYGRTPLSWAVTKGDFEEAAKALIAAGANVNCTDLGGFTPLMRAALLSHVRCFDLLVRNGADTETVHPDWRKTALDMAIERGSEALKAIAQRLKSQRPALGKNSRNRERSF